MCKNFFHTMLTSFIPCLLLSYHAYFFHTMLTSFIPCLLLSYHAYFFHTMLTSFIPCLLLSYHAYFFHTMLTSFIPCLLLSYHGGLLLSYHASPEVRGRFKRKFLPLRNSYFVCFTSNSSNSGDKLLRALKISTANNCKFL